MTTGLNNGLGESGFGPDPFLLNLTEDDLVDRGEVLSGGVVSRLNSFLRGEISASETYRMAIDKLGAKSEDVSLPSHIGLLGEMQAEHGRAAEAIRDRIRELGGEPNDSSGAWGAWAKFTEGAASLFGNAASLKALKEGEEHGLKDYASGLNDIDISSVDLVQNQLIPAQRRHIDLLDQLIRAAQA